MTTVQSINLKEWVEEVFGPKFAKKVDEGLEMIVVEASESVEEDEAEDDDEEEEGDEEEEDEDSEEEAEDDEEEPDDEEEEGEDLMALADVADSGGKSKAVKEAQARLTELAEEQDFDVETVETWTQVAEFLTEEEGDEEEEDEDDEEEEVQEPQKGEVCCYKPPKARKNVECEVVKVLKSKETVDLKNLENDKIYKSVPWDELVWE